MLRDDGWIWRVRAGKGERRVCWLPLVYRPLHPVVDTNIVISKETVALLTDSGRAVVLDFRGSA